MFLEQIGVPMVSGYVHVCDSKIIGGGPSFLWLKCSICGAIDFNNFPGLRLQDSSCIIYKESNEHIGSSLDGFPEQNEVFQGLKDYEESRISKRKWRPKSLWQRIKGLFK